MGGRGSQRLRSFGLENWMEGLTDTEARSRFLINVVPKAKQRSCSEKKLARMLRQLSIVCVQVKKYSAAKY